MTKLLEEGIKAVRELPEERQDAAGELLLAHIDSTMSCGEILEPQRGLLLEFGRRHKHSGSFH